MQQKIIVKDFFDKDTNTLTYVLYHRDTRDAVVIDPVLDFDPPSGRITFRSADILCDFVKNEELKVHYCLETHAHADHLSSSQILKKRFPHLKVAISKDIEVVQKTFKTIFNFTDEDANLSHFDLLLRDEQVISAGSLSIRVMATPGHTPACVSFLCDQHLFTGDALFMPDFGTGRCDFPLGSATQLYRSVKRLYELPAETNVYVGHDYGPNGRPIQFQTTIGEEREKNIQLKSQTTEQEYVSFRESRDKTLTAPKLLLPSIQVNIAAGRMPKAEKNGISYLKLPLFLP